MRGSFLVKYLRVPFFEGVPRATHLREIANIILAKFMAWEMRFISMVDRLYQVNSIISSSAVHSMMIYKWPKSLINELDMTKHNFIWTGRMSL